MGGDEKVRAVSAIGGATLRAWRRSRGWDVPEMARQLKRAAQAGGIPVATSQASIVQMIYAWERGDHKLTERYQLLYAAALGIDPDQLRPGVSGNELARPESAEELAGSGDGGDGAGQGGGEVASVVLGRVQELYRGTIDPHVVSQLHEDVLQAVQGYETVGHSSLVATLLRQRSLAETLLDQSRRPSQQRQLLEIAGTIAGVLGYVAVGPGNFGLARAYCREAFLLGDYAGAPALQAWARGTESFCEYYAGRYEEAVLLARDGLARAGTGPQSVRLSVNGLARALGKLGDADGVHRAVERAYELLSCNEVPQGVPSSIALGCYSQALTASNAATAYVALGMPQQARHYASQALPDITEYGPPWSRSLVMIDLALMDLQQDTGADLDRAAGLVLDALRISTGRPVISLSLRTAEFTRVAARWRKTPQIRAVAEAARAFAGSAAAPEDP
jgi:transcriptional regulator with XRE-family HTH domain/tetratricopeptide (TPR) repeat protein